MGRYESPGTLKNGEIPVKDVNITFVLQIEMPVLASGASLTPV